MTPQSTPPSSSQRNQFRFFYFLKKACSSFFIIIGQTGVSFYRNDGFRLASSLSFQTILSIVPAMLFVLWTIQQVHPDLGMSKISDILSPYFLSDDIKVATDKINEIIEKINFETIGWIGIIASFFATFGLSWNFKGALDRLFNIRNVKLNLLKRLAITCMVVLLFPLYIWITIRETRLYVHLPSILYLGRPYLVTILTLFVIYRYLPEEPPRWWSAVIGAVFTGLLLECERIGLARYFSAMKGVYSIIYGTLFLVPFCLLWLYLFWVVVLAGATLSSVIEKKLSQDCS